MSFHVLLLPLSVASTPLIQNYGHVFQILQACSRNASLCAKVVIIPCKVAVSGNKLSFWNNKGYSHRWHLKCLRTFMTKLIYISNQEFVALIISAAPGEDMFIARRSGFFLLSQRGFYLVGSSCIHSFGLASDDIFPQPSVAFLPACTTMTLAITCSTRLAGNRLILETMTMRSYLIRLQWIRFHWKANLSYRNGKYIHDLLVLVPSKKSLLLEYLQSPGHSKCNNNGGKMFFPMLQHNENLSWLPISVRVFNCFFEKP